MMLVKCLVKSMVNNIEEAREHIEKAYELRDTNRDTADWYRNMADVHLKFNDSGHVAVGKLIESIKSQYQNDPLFPGMMAVYNSKHADLIKETAIVRSMIDNYGK